MIFHHLFFNQLIFRFNEYFKYENTLFDLLYDDILYHINSISNSHGIYNLYSAVIVIIGNCQLIIFTEG